MNKILIASIIFVLIILPIKAKCQIYTRQVGNVFYGGFKDKDSLKKYEFSLAINNYVNKYYSTKKRIPIYFILSSDVNNELSYDNLEGNLLDLKLYKSKNRWKAWDFSGIRIVLKPNYQELATLLKLLDYGLNNLKILKAIYKKSAQMDDYDRPRYRGLTTEQIEKIITNELPRK